MEGVSKEDFCIIYYISEGRLRAHHAAWCAFQVAAGQDYNIIPTADQVESIIKSIVEFAKNPERTPEQSHELWMEVKIKNGWVYGPSKDSKKKTHPDLVPFDELPDVEKAKDVAHINTLRIFGGME